MTDEKLDFILSKQVADATKRAAADFVIDTGPLPSGVASFAPARAQLANCLHSLALTHAPKYAAWRVGAPLPPKPPSFIESDFTEKAAYEQWRAAQADDAAPYPEHPPVRAVSFDLDDTLFPCLPPILSASDFLATAIAEQLPRVAAAGGTERSAMRASESVLTGGRFGEVRYAPAVSYRLSLATLSERSSPARPSLANSALGASIASVLRKACASSWKSICCAARRALMRSAMR